MNPSRPICLVPVDTLYPRNMPCKCGATDHMRTTSRKCPLNKKLESSEGESESEEEVRYDVHGPAPDGFAQLDITSSEREAPEADTRKRSSRNRRLVDRFEAGASKAPKTRKARKAAKRPAIPKIEASKARKRRKARKAATRSAIPKRSAFHLPNLPSFADKYPALFAQTQNVTPSLQDDIYDATQEHVLCRMDIDNHVDHCLTVARNFINVVRDIRSDKGLEDVPDTDTIMDHVAVKSRAAYMSSHGCPDCPRQTWTPACPASKCSRQRTTRPRRRRSSRLFAVLSPRRKRSYTRSKGGTRTMSLHLCMSSCWGMQEYSIVDMW